MGINQDYFSFMANKIYPTRLVFLYMDQATLINEASKLEEALRSFVGKLPEAEETLKNCLVTAACNLEQRFDLRAQNYHARRRAGESQLANPRRLQLSRAFFKRKALKLQEQIRDNDGSKVSGRLRTMWLLRTALSDPCVPVRTLAEFCRDFHDLETSTISHTSIAAARDCFCEAIKLATGWAITDALSQLPAASTQASQPVILSHIHDEAALRLRSFDGALGPRAIRGRSSKVQNNCLTLFLGSESIEVASELQPLLRKDGATLGQAILDAVEEVLDFLEKAEPSSWNELRFFHLLTSDGVATNQLAARFVLAKFKQVAHLGSMQFSYFLLAHSCSSHQANLAVHTAIAGLRKEDPEQLVANCSRFYKHLLSDYLEEFSAGMRRFVEDTMEFWLVPAGYETEELLSQRSQMSLLQDLYGKSVLPDELLSFFNVALGKMAHAADMPQNIETIRMKAFQLLHKWVLRIEEHPVITRFFLFAPCIEGLLRMRLLQLPGQIFSLTLTRPREQNQRRLRRFLAFYDSNSAEKHLRMSCLCLQLTTHAVALTATKAPTVQAGHAQSKKNPKSLRRSLTKQTRPRKNLWLAEKWLPVVRKTKTSTMGSLAP